jgi:N utilization substance protein B
VRAKQREIDPLIEKAAPAYPMPQLASIDRAVLRVAVYELLFESKVPFRAVVNEAVEISKRFGGPNSGKFVNGVLRTISESLAAARKS